MSFGKSFHTLREARACAKKKNKGKTHNLVNVRRMDKKVHPRRKKLYHVGTYIDYLNFA